MGYRPTERDLYVAKQPVWGEAWDLMEPVIVPPSREVFMFGLSAAWTYMKRQVPSREYAEWVIRWAETNPEDMKEAP